MELGIEIELADTTQDAWKWRSVERKTDRDDALKLARLSALGQINRVHTPPPTMRQWRLVEHRQTLVGERDVLNVELVPPDQVQQQVQRHGDRLFGVLGHVSVRLVGRAHKPAAGNPSSPHG